MFTKLSPFALAVAASAVALGAAASDASAQSWDAFVIRNAATPITPVAPVEHPSGQGVTVLINEGGEKAGYGTSHFDNQSVAALGTVTYDRLDIGTGEIYSNIWVTNGTNYAVIAPAIGMNSTGNYTGGSNINGVNLQPLGFNIHEFTPGDDFEWILPGAQRVNSALLNADNSVITIADIGHLFIDDPNSPGNPVQGGTGAPKNGTGFNLIFGDTGSNHVQGIPYMIENVAVPEPTGLAVVGLGGAALLARRRRSA